MTAISRDTVGRDLVGKVEAEISSSVYARVVLPENGNSDRRVDVFGAHEAIEFLQAQTSEQIAIEAGIQAYSDSVAYATELDSASPLRGHVSRVKALEAYALLCDGVSELASKIEERRETKRARSPEEVEAITSGFDLGI